MLTTKIDETPSLKPLLQLEGIKKYYPIKKGVFSRTVGHIKAVDGIDLNVYPGETVGLVGESGCGKSTLGRSIMKLEELTEGSVMFQGRDLAQLPPSQMRSMRSELQMIFQDPYSSLNPRKRIVELLTEPLKVLSGMDDAEAVKHASELMHIVGLSPQSLGKYPHEFSGGQRQRIGIARAVGLRPRLIVCDEPVSALDVSIQAQILNLLKELQRSFRLTYLFIGHGLGSVKYMSDRIAVMYLGKIVELAPTKRLFAMPQHPYTKALLEAYPVPNPRLRITERTVLAGDVPSPASPPSGCRFHTRCPLAQPVCREREPVLSGGEHLVACHFPLAGDTPQPMGGIACG
ncbi:Vitamin B12 import ATP-binding protein BtuD [Paenibacillus solanacearum]|uniref:Vitamin B12 import ATP-binding protein BtuD n=1 Tax=Paenibacillus solanacearum TaxID=2048548 RepID=A0A916JWI3_9BACL|nr:oligopeptide/dipeptide ABC transporter ATP-binding protein [Paenibacillus solanacearum]CAG7610856.1 Vitamin B12 import ATP-binding protein BtuD [Paenibacillus solanacearum]